MTTDQEVVVLGATGQLGLFCIARLLRAGCNVLGVVREAPLSRDTAISGLYRISLKALVDQVRAENNPVLTGQHTLKATARRNLLSCGPIGIAQMLLQSTAHRASSPWTSVVVVGTTSTETKKGSSNSRERQQVREIDDLRKSVAKLCQSAGVPLIVLHPTMIYGCGMDQNVSRLYRWIARFGWMAVAGKAAGRRQPLHVDDLARTCVSAVMLGTPRALDTPVCGGDTLTYRAMVLRILELANRDGRLVSLPETLLAGIAGIAGVWKGSGGINAAMVRRQAVDQVFDDSPARKLLSHSARPFAPGEADFSLPAGQLRILEALVSKSDG